VFEALLHVLETGLLGNAVCKSDEVVDVDRAAVEESLGWGELYDVAVTHVGSIQDCALVCKHSDYTNYWPEGAEHPECVGFKFDTGGGGDCSLLFPH
jgi:hypothetical protein